MGSLRKAIGMQKQAASQMQKRAYAQEMYKRAYVREMQKRAHLEGIYKYAYANKMQKLGMPASLMRLLGKAPKAKVMPKILKALAAAAGIGGLGYAAQQNPDFLEGIFGGGDEMPLPGRPKPRIKPVSPGPFGLAPLDESPPREATQAWAKKLLRRGGDFTPEQLESILSWLQESEGI